MWVPSAPLSVCHLGQDFAIPRFYFSFWFEITTGGTQGLSLILH